MSNNGSGGEDGMSRREFMKLVGGAGLGAGLTAGSLNFSRTGAQQAFAASDDDMDWPPPKKKGVEKWGKRLNEYASKADIDWQQFSGTSLIFGMNVHPFTSTMRPLLDHFKELTGITVQFNEFPEDQLWQKLTLDLNAETGVFDGFFLGLWPSARYHNAGWVKNLNNYINDPQLTDKERFHREDFTEAALDALTYGKEGALVGIPFGVETYGCVGYDEPTFEKLGLDEPTNFEELRETAKAIHESDETDRDGICSRASSTTLSAANFGTMFKSYGADWFKRAEDPAEREAMLNSEEGIASLEMFAELMGDYGPGDIGTYDWYKSNQAFGNGEVGMVYSTPAAAGVFPQQQYNRTKFIPPLEGPDGHRVSDTWTWALGVSEFSRNPGAAWLFVNWATSRPANLMQSSLQWQGQAPYGHARNWIFDQPTYKKHGQSDSWIETHREGMNLVPSCPPPVPLDTPQNMDIMSEVAIQMNNAVTDNKSASKAFNDAAPDVTEMAAEIPTGYLKIPGVNCEA